VSALILANYILIYKEHLMNQDPERKQQSTPERREGLRINSIIIPADYGESLRQDELPREGLAQRQELVGGYIQGVELIEPHARLYCNEDGKFLQLPLNKRATLLLWAHNPRFRYQDYIAGDAYMVGPVRRSADSSVPDEYVHTLFKATRFRVELKPHASDKWVEHPERFDKWDQAYEHAFGWGLGLSALQGHGFADARVVPVDDSE
jgi:hypothetical protein